MKSRRILLGWILLLSWLLPGCSKSGTATLLPPSTPTASPTPLPTATATEDAATSIPQPILKRTQYRLQATLYFPEGILTVSEDIIYNNRSKGILPELEFIVEPNQNQGEFELLTDSCLGNGLPIQEPQLNTTSMRLSLNTPLQAGESVNIHLSYQVKLPSQAGVLSFGSRQVNLSGWVMVIVPFLEGTGWLQHPPGTVGEYQVNELADYDVRFTVVNPPEGLIVAASAPQFDDADGYHFVAKNVRNLTLSASPDYELLESSVGSIRIRAYVFPEHLEAGFAALEATSKSVELFSSIYGTYERPSLSLVESTFADGIEFDGLFYLGQEYFAVYKSGARNYLTALSAHETAHQWWYAMTSSDQVLEPWLDEALCTFSERLFYESVHPEDVEWWLQTRIQIYTPQGAVNSSIYDFSAFRPYVNAVYLRGAEFLGDLRDKMESSAFEAFLQDYFSTLNSKSEKDQLGLATAETFWQVLANHYEGDLKDLRSEYFK